MRVVLSPGSVVTSCYTQVTEDTHLSSSHSLRYSEENGLGDEELNLAPLAIEHHVSHYCLDRRGSEVIQNEPMFLGNHLNGYFKIFAA